MKQTLNEEINRIKKLLNIKESNIILEANPILGIVRRLGSAIESRFITGIEAKMGKRLANASDTEITTALKSAEMAAIRKEIAEAIYIADKNVIDSVLSKYNMTIPGDAAAAYTELSAQGYNRAILKDINKAYKAGRTSSGAGSGAGNTQPLTQPSPTGNSPTTGKISSLGDDAEEMIMATAKKDPNALAYYRTIENFGLSENVTTTMKLAYTKIGNKTPAEIYDEAVALSSRIDKKKYGWLIRIGEKIGKDPVKTVKVGGKTIAWSYLFFVIISTVITLGSIVLMYNEKIGNWFGVSPGISPGSGNNNNSGGKGRFN
jgi:hypothetical protein